MTYLKLLKNKNKTLFLLVITFMGLNLITNLLNREFFPFFVYKMYSYPIPKTEHYEFYQLNYNNNSLLNNNNIWDHHKRLLFQHTIQHYDYCINNNGYDDTQLKLMHFLNKLNIVPKEYKGYPYRQYNTKDYPRWLLEYSQQMTTENIDSISVIKFTADYKKNKIEIINKKQLLKYKK